MKRFTALFIMVSLMLTVACVGKAENQQSFDESVFTNAGYSSKGDIFSGQKTIYKPDFEVVMLDYSTKVITWGSKIDSKIFGKDAKEEGEMPAWTQGDHSAYHKSQTGTKCYPSVVYNSSHAVPYTFVVAMSLPPRDNWLGVQAPESIMIATDSHIYTLKRYLSSSEGFYRDIVFMTMDESGMEMFYDMNESGRLVVRATGPFGETVDFTLKVPVTGTIGEGVEVDEAWFEGVRDVLEAWDLYVQAGGTQQDLTVYANAIEVTDTQRDDVDATEQSANPEPETDASPEPATEPTAEPTATPAPVYETLQKGSKGEAVVRLQEKLIALDYLNGKADGDFGKGTAGAIEKFQSDEGLPVNGIADNETQIRLYAKEIPFRPDVKVASVRTGQSYSGSLQLYVQLENVGKSTIDRVDFHVQCWNAYGELMTYKGSKYVDCYYSSDIKAGKKMPSDWHYDFSGLNGATKFAICIYRYHYKNGETVDIDLSDQTWDVFG